MENDKKTDATSTLLPIAELTLAQVERIAGLSANLVLLLKRSDERNANRGLQFQADVNALRDMVSTLQSQVSNLDRGMRSLIDSPSVLAAMVPKATIDEARQIARRAELVDSDRRDREDDSLVNIKLPGSRALIPVSNRWLLGAVVTAIGSAIGWVVHWFASHR